VRRLVLFLVALAFVVAGCKVDATVTVTMEEDGSGVVALDVRLDPEAVKATEADGGKLQERVRLAGLREAGWRIGDWVRTPDGAAALRMTKAFTSPEQLAGIVAELNGSDGPLRDFRAERDRGLLGTDYEVTGAIDLAAVGTGIATDPDLVGALTNQQIDVNAVDQSLLQQLRDSLTTKVVVELPDGTTTVNGVAGQRTAVEADTSVRDDRRIVLVLVAVALLVIAVIVFVGGSHSRRKARARAPIPRFDPHSPRRT
jgi:hypothetical protein